MPAACINTLDNYLASCAYNFTQLNYGILDSFANQLSNDCADSFNAAERSFAATFCSSAFDHIVGFVESAANLAVVVSGGVMTTPYSCLLADNSTCPVARPPSPASGRPPPPPHPSSHIWSHARCHPLAAAGFRVRVQL